MRPEIEKTLLAAGVNDVELENILRDLDGTFLQIEGGVGVVAEYLSKRGKKVVLQDSNRLSFSYRRSIVPSSTVQIWNVDITAIKLDKPVFDYVIIRGAGHRDLASKIAKKGIINLEEKSLEHVVHTTKNSKPDTKVDRNINTTKRNEPDDLHKGNVAKSGENAPSIPSNQSMVDME